MAALRPASTLGALPEFLQKPDASPHPLRVINMHLMAYEAAIGNA
jgi:hypothetical protein